MKKQFIKISSWMLDLGLTASELIVFAVIHAYTGFKGEFSGDPAWLALWARIDEAELGAVLESLAEQKIVIRKRGLCGQPAYMSVFPDDSRRSSHNINNINNIDHIDNIDRSISSIDKIGRPAPYEGAGRASVIEDINIGRAASASGAGRPSAKEYDEKNRGDGAKNERGRSARRTDGGKPKPTSAAERGLTPDEIQELIKPYKHIWEVPVYELIEKEAAFRKKLIEEEERQKALEAGRIEEAAAPCRG